MQIVVGISEWAVSASAEDTLVTHSLGSCLGLALYDPEAGIGGLLHAMMPVSTLDPLRAQARPAMFVDTGVAALLGAMFDLGARRQSLIATAVGGGRQINAGEFFRIGERNYTVMRRMLWKNEILIAAEDVGGARSRTIYLEMSTGRTLVRSDGLMQVLAVGRKE